MRRRSFHPLWVVCLAVLAVSRPVMAQTDDEPSVYHGFAKVIGGIVFELPKTVLEATFDNPPIVGTVVGLLAGTSRAFQTTFSGLAEMAAGFDPWGSKKARRQ